MRIPFTSEQFLGFFERYNQAIWPTQILAFALGAVVLLLLWRRPSWAGRAISAILAAAWIFTGIVCHMWAFTSITKGGYIYGIAFVIEGLLIAALGVGRNQFRIAAERGLRFWAGFGLALYSMAAYPALGYVFGHVFPKAPSFGIAPCPLTIFTLGVLLATERPMPRVLGIIPALWSVVGLGAAYAFGIYEDIVMPVAGVAFVTLAFREREARRRFGSRRAERRATHNGAQKVSADCL